jgi:hypothetical protein
LLFEWLFDARFLNCHRGLRGRGRLDCRCAYWLNFFLSLQQTAKCYAIILFLIALLVSFRTKLASSP